MGHCLHFSFQYGRGMAAEKIGHAPVNERYISTDHKVVVFQPCAPQLFWGVDNPVWLSFNQNYVIG
ncbi:hypothetical protein GCM10022398_24150 [Acetobacter lovaniensis]|nr:hypothetical protein AA0474_0419 [Acetobacter lovaniensis NRIC 0474]